MNNPSRPSLKYYNYNSGLYFIKTVSVTKHLGDLLGREIIISLIISTEALAESGRNLLFQIRLGQILFIISA